MHEVFEGQLGIRFAEEFIDQVALTLIDSIGVGQVVEAGGEDFDFFGREAAIGHGLKSKVVVWPGPDQSPSNPGSRSGARIFVFFPSRQKAPKAWRPRAQRLDRLNRKSRGRGLSNPPQCAHFPNPPG